jgi:phosphohistidine phosphatase SixA
MPSLAEHLAALIGAESAHGLSLSKGGVACVEMESLRAGTGHLRWLMRQKQLREVTK